MQSIQQILAKSDRQFAAEYAMSAVSKQRDWRFGSHHCLVQAARNISASLADTSIYERFRETRRLHAGYYQGFLEAPEVVGLRTNVHIFVHRILRVAE